MRPFNANARAAWKNKSFVRQAGRFASSLEPGGVVSMEAASWSMPDIGRVGCAGQERESKHWGSSILTSRLWMARVLQCSLISHGTSLGTREGKIYSMGQHPISCTSWAQRSKLPRARGWSRRCRREDQDQWEPFWLGRGNWELHDQSTIRRKRCIGLGVAVALVRRSLFICPRPRTPHAHFESTVAASWHARLATHHVCSLMAWQRGKIKAWNALA